MRRELGMLMALVLMCAGLWFSNPDFLGQSNVMNTTRLISMLGIYAIGIGFVIITGGIDLSVGSVIGLTGVIIAKLSGTIVEGNSGGLGYSLWMSVPIALMIACLIGLIQGLLITRLSLQPFIVTLGFMLLLRGVSQTLVRGGSISIGDLKIANLAESGWFYVNGSPLFPYPLIIFVVVLLLATYALHFTVFGRYVYAIGGNRDAARYSGIAVKKVETLAYVISAGLGGIAGICYASYIKEMTYNVGIAYELYAIAAAVLGGCSLRGGEGTVLGIVIGSAVMKVIDNGINMFQFRYTDANQIRRIWRLDNNWTFIIIGAVILIAVILDQVVHIVQAGRRTRKAGATNAPPGGFEVGLPAKVS
jgi:ribose transport system permease protein